MTVFADEPVPREPPALARLLVYVFALSTPPLTLIALFVPGVLVSRYGLDANGVTIAAAVSVAYAGALIAAIRAVRRVAVRFNPPLALPGDIWNIGVALPPKRSRNWPIRLGPRAIAR